MRDSKWVIRTQNEAIVKQLCQTHGLPEVTARLLCNRGITDPIEVQTFFGDKLYETLHNPFLLPDMNIAVTRLRQAIRNGEKITVYGDYDVDGITSTVILYTYLSSTGACVDYYIPSRLEEGYGLNRNALDQIRENGTKLLVTVDTGTTAAEEVIYAKQIGLDVLITDHHECVDQLPDCPVVNPKRKDSEYPFPNLAGVGVTFKLICACMENTPAAFEQFGILTAIGTIADIMPLKDENRSIVREGLRLLNTAPPPGIQALLGVSAADGDIDSGTVAYQIAPLMNAAGRVGDPKLSVRLLLCKDLIQAKKLAEELNRCNLDRKEKEQTVIRDIDQILHGTQPTDKILVFGSETWHNGVIGIAASRLTERYCRPCILLCFDKNKGKGSARSVKGVNLFELVSRTSEKLENFGGHEMAVGLTLDRKNYDAFVKEITETANQTIREDNLQPVYEAECEIRPEELNFSFTDACDLLEPFGNGNPSPFFVLRNLKLENCTAVGGGKHTRLQLQSGTQHFTAMYFGKTQEQIGCMEKEPIDLLCSVHKRIFQNKTTLNIIVKDLKPADDPEEKKHRQHYERFCKGESLPAEEKITREDLAAFYRWTCKHSAPGKPVQITSRRLTKELKKSIPDFSLCRLLLCKDVLTELALLIVQGNNLLQLEPIKTTQKADLTKANRWEELCRG